MSAPSRPVLLPFLSLVLVFAVSAATAAGGWDATATQAVGPRLARATDRGPLPAYAPMRVTLALKLRNQAALQQLLHDQATPGNPRYRAFITPAQFLKDYGPTAAQVRALQRYLGAHGFRDIQVEPNRMFITARGTAAQASAAFDTQIERFQRGGREVYANLRPARLPASLGAPVVAVMGLDNTSQMQLPQAVACLPAPGPCLGQFFTPEGFQQAYDADGTATGSGTAIAVFAEGDVSSVITDLRFAEAQNGLPQVPVQVVQVGAPSSDTSGVDEWDLDTQMSTGMAQTVSTLYIYAASSLTDADLALAFNRFVTDDLAKGGNASFGICEAFAALDGSMQADDQVFAEAAAQGQTVFASTGDTGATCPVAGTNGVPDSGLPMMSYPAASPYVVAVGGTDLFVNEDGSYNTETGWEAGGGGISLFESAPAWQSGSVPAGAAGRGVPDVAMDAGLETGALVYIGGQENTIGGTSLASPLALGVWARLESAHGNQLGFASPILYRLDSGLLAPASGFHDIQLGCNGLYCAAPGWDYVTGLGSFDVGAVNSAVTP